MPKLSRRAVLAASTILPMLSTRASAAEEEMPLSPNSKLLVAYFTRSGNTAVIAGTIHRALKTTLFQIQPETAYPEDYEGTVAQAAMERDSSFEPPLAAAVPDFASYDAIFLGFPIWGETAPPVIRSFLRQYETGGKTIRPFITHGGYGTGDSLAVLRDHAPKAKIARAFVLEADQERRTLNKVMGWIEPLERG